MAEPSLAELQLRRRNAALAKAQKVKAPPAVSGGGVVFHGKPVETTATSVTIAAPVSNTYTDKAVGDCPITTTFVGASPLQTDTGNFFLRSYRCQDASAEFPNAAS